VPVQRLEEQAALGQRVIDPTVRRVVWLAAVGDSLGLQPPEDRVESVVVDEERDVTAERVPELCHGVRAYPLTNVVSIDKNVLMTVDLELVPKQKRPAGEPCCEPVVYPDVEREQALRMAHVAKALGDPVRLQLVDVLRKHAGKVCVCELVPLFDLSQPTVSHHLKVLREAGIVGSERVGLWAYYYVIPDSLKELSAWLS
jgi:ArsR family transcriptional regulator